MNAVNYLNFFGEMYGMTPHQRADRAVHLLTYFGLWDARLRPIGTYSKGMRQKVALARALYHDPDVILLDEPTSAMDPASAKSVRDYISGLKQAGKTILICTHNLAEAETLADSIAIIKQGRIIAQGTSSELKQRWLGLPVYEVRLQHHRQLQDLLQPPANEYRTVQLEDSFSLRIHHPWRHLGP